jgi:hypothetical protein
MFPHEVFVTLSVGSILVSIVGPLCSLSANAVDARGLVGFEPFLSARKYPARCARRNFFRFLASYLPEVSKAPMFSPSALLALRFSGPLAVFGQAAQAAPQQQPLSWVPQVSRPWASAPPCTPISRLTGPCCGRPDAGTRFGCALKKAFPSALLVICPKIDSAGG